jgi:hypothetical protein
MAEWLGPAKQTYYFVSEDPEDEGKLVPAVGGLLYHYVPGTDDPKDTWQDPDEDALNTNPVVLDEFGQAAIFGDGLYRQLFTTPTGDQIWDNITGTPPAVEPEPDPIYWDSPFEFLGAPPLTNEIMGMLMFDRPVSIPADFDGTPGGFQKARGVCLTAPSTDDFVIDVKKNNATSIGTITITQTTGDWAFETAGNVQIDLIAGDYLVFIAQTTVDAALANLAWTITGLVV